MWSFRGQSLGNSLIHLRASAQAKLANGMKASTSYLVSRPVKECSKAWSQFHVLFGDRSCDVKSIRTEKKQGPGRQTPQHEHHVEGSKHY